MRLRSAYPRTRLLPALALAWLPAGCAGAPSLTIAGAYFPAWLACALAGIAGALAARFALIAFGMADSLPAPLLVCAAVGTLCGLALWAAWIGA